MKLVSPNNRPSFDLELSYPNYIVAGIDEAGCGPWAGPVVAGAAILNQETFPAALLKSINDSKKLSRLRREKIYAELMDLQGKSIHFSVGQATVHEIDTLNIAGATKLAMVRAIAGLSVAPTLALVDGVRLPSLPCKALAIVKGDQRSFSIACASILAKVTRDQMMENLHMEYPHYHWNKNAGYGTADHQQALEIHGVTPHHRHTYAPIARLVTLKKKVG